MISAGGAILQSPGKIPSMVIYSFMDWHGLYVEVMHILNIELLYKVEVTRQGSQFPLWNQAVRSTHTRRLLAGIFSQSS